MDLMNINDRKSLLSDIDSSGNMARKKASLYAYEVYKNKLKDHVTSYLKEYLSEKSVKRMSIIRSVGMCERIIDQEASIYDEAPKREFTGVNESQSEVINRLYSEMNYDEKCKIHNRMFKLQHQALSYIVPKNGKLRKRVLLEHQYDIIPNLEDPENPIGYVISNMNQPKEKENQRFVWWSQQYNFTTDGNGVVLTKPEDIKNPIEPLLPFVVASYEKNGEYYPDEEETSVHFTIQLNAALTELLHIMRMQGFGQAVITGPKKAIPKAEELEVGVNSIIALITEEGDTADFKFVNASPDISGSIEVISTLLSAYLSSKGIDPKEISINGESPQSFASGWERFLAMIDKFKATKDDIEIFNNVEEYEFDIVRAWHNKSIGTDTLDKDLIGSIISDKAEIKTKYHRPEALMTEQENIDATKSNEDNNYISHLEAIKRIHNLDTIKEAEEKYKEIQDQNKEFPSGGKKVEVVPPISNNDPALNDPANNLNVDPNQDTSKVKA